MLTLRRNINARAMGTRNILMQTSVPPGGQPSAPATIFEFAVIVKPTRDQVGAITPHIINHERVEEAVRKAVSNRRDVTVERVPHMFATEHTSASSKYQLGTAVVVKWAAPQPDEVLHGVQLAIANQLNAILEFRATVVR